jgi:hypothetical protein
MNCFGSGNAGVDGDEKEKNCLESEIKNKEEEEKKEDVNDNNIVSGNVEEMNNVDEVEKGEDNVNEEIKNEGFNYCKRA